MLKFLSIEKNPSACGPTRSVVSDEQVLPFVGRQLLFSDDFHGIVLPFVDDVSSRFASLEPKVEAPVRVCFVHFCKYGAVLVAVGSLDPTTVTEGLVPLGILEALDLDEPIALDFQTAVELGVSDRFRFAVEMGVGGVSGKVRGEVFLEGVEGQVRYQP